MSDDPAGAPPQFLIHHEGDSVAVAVTDLEPGAITGAVLKGGSGERLTYSVTERIPLGHKFAVAAIAEGGEVRKYGVRVGVATRPISIGDYVHVHNMRSARWSTSHAS